MRCLVLSTQSTPGSSARNRRSTCRTGRHGAQAGEVRVLASVDCRGSGWEVVGCLCGPWRTKARFLSSSRRFPLLTLSPLPDTDLLSMVLSLSTGLCVPLYALLSVGVSPSYACRLSTGDASICFHPCLVEHSGFAHRASVTGRVAEDVSRVISYAGIASVRFSVSFYALGKHVLYLYRLRKTLRSGVSVKFR